METTKKQRVFRTSLDSGNHIGFRAFEFFQKSPFFEQIVSDIHNIEKITQNSKFIQRYKESIKPGMHFSSNFQQLMEDPLSFKTNHKNVIKNDNAHIFKTNVSSTEKIELRTKNNLIKKQQQKKVQKGQLQIKQDLKLVEIRYSLLHLSAMVKNYLQIMRSTNSTNVQQEVFRHYLHHIGIDKPQSEESLLRLRRRVCQIIRVFQAMQFVKINQRAISITQLGLLTGRAKHPLHKKIKQKQKIRDAMKQKLLFLQKKRNCLKETIECLDKLSNRNRQNQINKYLDSNSANNYQEQQEERFQMPLVIVAGQSNSSIFKIGDIESVQQRQNGLAVSGIRIRILSTEAVIKLLLEN